MIQRLIKATAIPAVVVAALTVLVTWPQALYIATRVSAHDDALFSIWRLTWIAHALATDPAHLFDANIFHPAMKSLTFSDAMLLEGALAAPFLWVGISPTFVYNLLLLGGIAASGLAMFVLARHVLQATGPAIVSAAIFTMAPYRVEHFMHLELQWAMWIPLTLWCVHRTLETRDWRYGLLTGVLLWLQVLSSIYYGVFLAITVVAFVPLMVAAEPRAARALPLLLAGCILALTLAAPYALLYVRSSQTLGDRDVKEIFVYSARLTSYLAGPAQSWLWRWTGDRWGGTELSLFPGATAIALAAASAFRHPRRMVLVYAALALITIELSLGLNGHLYTWLYNQTTALRGLRSPSRFGIIACCAIAMLAGFGAQALIERVAARGRRSPQSIVTALTVLVAIDNATRGMGLTDLKYEPPKHAFSVYKSILELGPGAILELPIASLDALPGHEPTYTFWSIAHWQPLVNGYSGYYPPEFKQTVVRLENFPDDRSLRQLSNIGVRYVVVHRAFYDVEPYNELMLKIAGRPELAHQGTYSDPAGEAQLFVLQK